MENTKSKRKKIVLPMILALVIIGSATFGITRYLHAVHYVDTDDAQVDGDITPVIVRVGGYIDQVRFEDNQPIKKGDTLVTIDKRDLQIKQQQAIATFQNAQASVAVAEANYTTAQSNLAAATANVKAAEVRVWKANQDYTRYSNLLNDKAVTQQQFDNVKAEKLSAESQMDAVKKQQQAVATQIKTAEQQVEVAKSMLVTRQADIDFANLQLSYTVLIAPATGTVSKKNVQPGQLVNAGNPLCAVVTDSNIFVTANFKETQLEHMHIGQKVEVIADAYPDKIFEGSVYVFSAATGAKFSLLPPDNATGNFVKVVQRIPVKIKLNSKDEMIKLLKPGMSIKVSVDIK